MSGSAESRNIDTYLFMPTMSEAQRAELSGLFFRMQGILAHATQTAGRGLGESTLVMGDATGAYAQILPQLGARRTIGIHSDTDSLTRAWQSGRYDEVWPGSLLAWLNLAQKAETPAVASAVLFNVSTREIEDTNLVFALERAVRPGGAVIMTYSDPKPSSLWQFGARAGAVMERARIPSSFYRSIHDPAYRGKPNAFIDLWLRL